MSSSGRNLSAFLLTPPPTTMRSGHNSRSIGLEVAGQPLRPLRPGEALGVARAVRGPRLGVLAVDLEVAQLGVRHEHARRRSGRCRCPVPERGHEDGARARPSPLRTSPRRSPAASASLTTRTGRPSVSRSSVSTSVPIHDLSTLAAVRATPCWITAGNVTPIGPGARRVPELPDDLRDHAGHGRRRGRRRRRRPDPLGGERAGVQVHRAPLDARAADVDPEPSRPPWAKPTSAGAVVQRSRSRRQGRVRISAPVSVTSTVCSNCALRRRSLVTTVHPSSHMSHW